GLRWEGAMEGSRTSRVPVRAWLGAALLLALPAALAPWTPVRMAIATLAAADAVLTWITIWAPDDGGHRGWAGPPR
ncbi:MAG: hypothetical protein ACPGRF_03580, partial [Miltoncostaeaceae bacterium]